MIMFSDMQRGVIPTSQRGQPKTAFSARSARQSAHLWGGASPNCGFIVRNLGFDGHRARARRLSLRRHRKPAAQPPRRIHHGPTRDPRPERRPRGVAREIARTSSRCRLTVKRGFASDPTAVGSINETANRASGRHDGVRMHAPNLILARGKRPHDDFHPVRDRICLAVGYAHERLRQLVLDPEAVPDSVGLRHA